MKNGKFAKRGIASKTLVMILALVLVVGCTVGGTLAWLTDKTDEVKNTFTTSDIEITLKETTTEYKMVPGYDIAKDPKVKVTAGSEAAWLFVKFGKSANFDQYMTYEVADGWTEVETGVYARKVATADIGKEYSVLKGDKVTVKGEVTKAMMETAKTNQPTLTFTAYASQLMKNNTEEFTAAQAWANVNPTTPQA